MKLKTVIGLMMLGTLAAPFMIGAPAYSSDDGLFKWWVATAPTSTIQGGKCTVFVEVKAAEIGYSDIYKMGAKFSLIDGPRGAWNSTDWIETPPFFNDGASHHVWFHATFILPPGSYFPLRVELRGYTSKFLSFDKRIKYEWPDSNGCDPTDAAATQPDLTKPEPLESNGYQVDCTHYVDPVLCPKPVDAAT